MLIQTFQMPVLGSKSSALDVVAFGCKTQSSPINTNRMLQRLKPLLVKTVLLDRSNDPLHQSDLLWAMRRDEFMLQTIAFHLKPRLH